MPVSDALIHLLQRLTRIIDPGCAIGCGLVVVGVMGLFAAMVSR